MRALVLQEAIESTGRQVETAHSARTVRLSFAEPAPAGPWWPILVAALRQADRWGHLHLASGSTVWAEIEEEADV